MYEAYLEFLEGLGEGWGGGGFEISPYVGEVWIFSRITQYFISILLNVMLSSQVYLGF